MYFQSTSPIANPFEAAFDARCLDYITFKIYKQIKAPFGKQWVFERDFIVPTKWDTLQGKPSFFNTDLSHLAQSGAANIGDIIVWDGSKWITGTLPPIPDQLLQWEVVSTDTFQMENGKGYIINSINTCELTLPLIAIQGDLILIVGKSANGWKVLQNASQQINIGSITSMAGVGSGIKSTSSKDCAELICITDDTEWNVRDTSPNTTISAFTPFILPDLLWLDAALGITETGGAVSLWADQSGTGNDASQSTGANKPQLVTGVINGLPVLRFDGAASFMTCAGAVIPITQHTIFIVSKAAVSHDGFLVTTFNGNGEFTRYRDNAGTLQMRFVSNATAVDVNVPSPTAFHYFTIKIEATSAVSAPNTIYINGVNSGSASFQLAPAGANMWIGQLAFGGFFLNGDIAEIMIYNSALSDTDREDVEAYLLNKYGL